MRTNFGDQLHGFGRGLHAAGGTGIFVCCSGFLFPTSVDCGRILAVLFGLFPLGGALAGSVA